MHPKNKVYVKSATASALFSALFVLLVVAVQHNPDENKKDVISIAITGIFAAILIIIIGLTYNKAKKYNTQPLKAIDKSTNKIDAANNNARRAMNEHKKDPQLKHNSVDKVTPAKKTIISKETKKMSNQSIKANYLGDTKLMEDLLNKGADCDYQKDTTISKERAELSNQLIKATSLGNTKLMKDLLNKGANCDYQDNDGFTALIQAANNNNVEAAELLIGYGANLDLPDFAGDTPAILAARFGRNELLQLLINKGANINQRNGDDFSPAAEAAHWGNAQALSLLLQHTKANTQHGGKSLLMIACSSEVVFYDTDKAIETINVILTHNNGAVNIDHRDDHVMTAIDQVKNEIQKIHSLMKKNETNQAHSGIPTKSKATIKKANETKLEGFKTILSLLEEHQRTKTTQTTNIQAQNVLSLESGLKRLKNG